MNARLNLVAEAGTLQAVCFGKLPSLPDFVPGARRPRLSAWIDRWVSPALDAAADDPHWKRLYDGAPGLDFAVLGPGTPAAVAGHLRPSVDACGRRFPFVVAVQCDSVTPRERLARAPLVFARLWARCADAAQRAAGPAGRSAASACENELETLRLPAPCDYDAACADHAALETLAGLERRLRAAHPAVDLRATLLALGALLQPLARRGSPPPACGLSLPLPAAAADQAVVAAWWTTLVADLLAPAGQDWLLMRPGGGRGPAPRLLVELAGATPAALSACWDPQRLAARYIDLAAPDWAEAVAGRDERTRRLGAYLAHDSLSLALAAASWREAFEEAR
ncbi:type VI secretion system protein ImpM [Rubrivivax gelatinosus]|uniref:type VI secretion system-associated protein TagF n=1 Tax=Rubrivivax gelatinosus TaxID=28068 RepID=UPI0018C8F098|nr:type VI secretion system-associated protein TagF [Rubrivivax gelatinosus]MBG6078460.1 type VI secretion system protein ImpM [Rubrivivax gelatinosus]